MTGVSHALVVGYYGGICFAPDCTWMGRHRSSEEEAHADAEAHFASQHATAERATPKP